jgi:hypothetical protein
MLIDVMPGLGPALAQLPGHPTVVTGLVVTGLVTGACVTVGCGGALRGTRCGPFWRRRRRTKRPT